MKPSDPAETSFEFAGVYYRHFRRRGGHTWWTLTVSMLYCVAATLVLPLVWLRSRLRVKRRISGICLFCGYDLRATPHQCPECGRLVVAPNGAQVCSRC